MTIRPAIELGCAMEGCSSGYRKVLCFPSSVAGAWRSLD